MARLLVKKGEYENVKSLWEEAIDIFPDFAWSHIELGEFYYQKEDNIKNAVKYIYQGKLIAEKNSILSAIDRAEKLFIEIRTKIGDEKFNSLLLLEMNKLL